MNYLYEQSDILNAPFEAFVFETGKDSLPVTHHWHYFTEVILIKTGMVEAVCNQKHYILEEGDMILFYPQAVHALYALSGVQVTYEVLKFDINRIHMKNAYSPNFRSILKSAEANERATIYFPSDIFQTFSPETVFQECRKEITEKEFGYDIKFESMIACLLVEVLRIWRKDGFEVKKVSEGSERMDSFPEVLEYIDAHISETIRVEELAKQCHMSYSYFAKNFREIYGQSCKDYIDFVRTSRVEDLLLFTEYDLTYISQETGFADCSHLIRIFKKRFGVTPKQYRKRYQRK